MGTLLRKWKPHNKFTKALRLIIKIIAYLILIGFIILPFCNLPENISQISKWVWLGCALLNLDIFAEYKKAKAQKLFCPIISLYIILTLSYLYNYWSIVPLSVVICGSIIICLLEFIITVASTKTVRLSDRQKYIEYPPEIIHGFVLGGLYFCSITFFVMGHFISQLLLFVFGGIALLFLAVSILLSLGNGLSAKKNIFNLIGFILDALSFLALMIYLIYIIPEEYENLQTIITTIIAAVLGGVLTLAGVAWTIKFERERHRREEMLKCKPMFRYCDFSDENIPEGTRNFFFIDGEVAEEQYGIEKMCFKNFDNAYLVIESIIVNDILLKPLEIVSIEKGDYFYIFFNLGTGRGVENFLLNIKDILGNPYRFELVRGRAGEITGIREVKEK